MDFERFGRWQLYSILRSCAVLAVATFSTFLFIAASLIVAFIMPLPRHWEDLRFVLGLSSGVLLNVGLWFCIAVVVVVLRKRKLNRVMQVFQVDFRSSFFGQRYQTQVTVDGMEVNVLLQQGPMLTLTIPVTTHVRLSVRNLSANQPVTWEQLQIQSSDAQWLKQWSALTTVHEIVLKLVTLGSTYEVRTISFTPESLQLQLYRFPLQTLTSTHAELLVKGLVILAKAAAATPAPATPVEQNSLERFANNTIYRPGKSALWVLLIVFVIILLAAIPAGFLVVAAFLFSR